MTSQQKQAVVLFSGGLDSTTCLAIAKNEGYDIHALSFSYGQKHTSELLAAQRIAKKMNVLSHRIAQIDLGLFGGSALTDTTLEVPTLSRAEADVLANQKERDVPITYVPARNTIFLSYALGLAEVTKSEAIFIGVNAVDFSGYPDCREEFITAFQNLAQKATASALKKEAPKIRTPLQHLSKAEIITQGISFGIDYGESVSCYNADEKGQACGGCEACHLRKKGFEEANVPDPTRYQ